VAEVTLHLEVSEHACLRWLERRHGIDLEAIRAEIHAAAYPAASLGATRISTGGVTLVIAIGHAGGKVVATVLPCASPGTAREFQAIANGYQISNKNISKHELGKVRRRHRQQRGNA
jgi:hypothetical protein